jgi:hypothetical protein
LLAGLSLALWPDATIMQFIWNDEGGDDEIDDM